MWYDLALKAIDQEAIRLPVLKAELGKTTSYDKWLSNPSNIDTRVDCLVSNPSNYDVYPENIMIPAHGKTKITIVYTPA